ncbi:Lrp/AsnC family transcriptional regulator [Yoonia sediminilitoris]|uniref:AsnC family transcriptional regulator n=1 Tax=Yoonia sediminilitoris TaxID=1286148 RepID=A0A2T6KCZ2_9RHOB|nr:Lrp/AsnC family transcriptional regulator [Yoonia sediminilitoris]PUB12805.1 AsnC family transcriptional regulator [Yoonia sediminilitoris]RCW94284.1 AsnC family transcriptional regulator [Yoonia sediminilitoris]
MDELDHKLIAALKRNGRASLSELAATLGVTRSTVRTRLRRLQDGGEIAGFTVLTRSDVRPDAVRGLMMLEIAGRGAERAMPRLITMAGVRAVHSTNGTWDIIAEIGAATLEEFDRILFAIRRLDGVTRSETSLLLSTRR